MSKSFIFTIIIPFIEDNNDFKECLNSISNQTGFEDNFQLVFAQKDDYDKFNDLYPENIFVLNHEDVMKNIYGSHVHFLDTNNRYSQGLFTTANSFFLKNDDVNIICCQNRNQVIDINAKQYISIPDISQSFINRDMLDSQIVNEIVNGNGFYYFNELIIESGKFGIVDAKIEKGNMQTITSDWLSNRILQYKMLLDYSDSNQVKYNVIEDLNRIIINPSFNQMEGSYELIDDLKDVLANIDDDIIKRHEKLKKNIKSLLIYLKSDDFHAEIKKDKLFLKTGNYVINGLHGHAITIDIVDLNQGILNVSGAFKSSCNPDFLDFKALVKHSDGSQEIYLASKHEYPTTERARRNYFGFDWTFNPCFDFKIPVKPNDNFKIDFEIAYHENNDEKTLKNNRLKFQNYCNLSELSNYFVKNGHIVLFRDNAIHVTGESLMFRSRLEFDSVKSIIKSDNEHKWYSIYIRFIYFILYSFLKSKRIWLFEDRPLVADDNAKHLFSYAVGQNDEVEKYYILDKDSQDFDDMKKISKNIVAFGSLKHKMLYLFGEKFISSHSGNYITNPFYEYDENLFCGLTTIEKVFLQHGITIHDVSNWLRKYRHNFYLFTTASEYEQKSILHRNYNYSQDIVKVLGFPRYDNLNNQKLEKQILFMPTWRKGISDEKDFLSSKYYSDIESLFNNEMLCDMLNRNGFKIVFKPHFEILKYVHLFNLPECVELNVDDSYQTLFNSSMILITDYSSVFFDFAYLKKPVIYYRDDEKFHYDSGYFDFESMGFGDIISDEDILVDKIDEYISNDCKMEDKFIKRVDDFFKFNDRNNCRRVYDCLYEIE